MEDNLLYSLLYRRRRKEKKKIMESKFPYEIRWIYPEEWEETIRMIWRTFIKFEAKDYSQQGIRNFNDFLNDGELYSWYLQGKYQMLVALDGEKIVGEISVRNGNFISLLFVDEAYHCRGIGRELVRRMGEYLKTECKEVYMSVKAAPYAVGFYKKLGFRVSRPEEEVAGIRVTAMEKFL